MGLATAIKSITKGVYEKDAIFLDLRPSTATVPTIDKLQQVLDGLSQPERNAVHYKVWELAKVQDPSVDGERWGEEHAFGDVPRLAAAMRRLGMLDAVEGVVYPARCLAFHFGEGGLGAQYFSLSEKLGRDPSTGLIGYVNGMGVQSLEHAGLDTVTLSERFFDGNNVHVMYNPTHQSGDYDMVGLTEDAMRMKAVAGGAISKQAYLLAQMWIDYLDAHPGRNFLQTAHSEGSVHVTAALRLMRDAGAGDFLHRIRVLTFGPADFVFPQHWPGIQAINLIKAEDMAVRPWGAIGSKLSEVERRRPKHICFVDHRVRADDVHNHPHDFMSWDFVEVARPCIRKFFETGDIE